MTALALAAVGIVGAFVVYALLLITFAIAAGRVIRAGNRHLDGEP